jgi:hypothetical protein
LAGFGLLAAALASLLFAWQYLVTGDPFLNTYTLWWPYDKVGFGPGYGVMPEGHNLAYANVNTRFSLKVGWHDLFGWGAFSWIFLPFGIWAARRNGQAWLIAGVFPSLVLVYMAYFIGSWIVGPRYYYEGLYSLTLLSAAGILFLAGLPHKPGENIQAASGWTKRWWRQWRPLLVTALVTALVGMNLLYYTPLRLEGLHNLYGIGRKNLEPFLTPEIQEYTPALIIVHSEDWMSYGALLALEDPYLGTPLIFAWNMNDAVDARVAAHYPNRSVYHYYPDQPYTFFTAPLQENPANPEE